MLRSDPVWHPFTQEGEYQAERDRVVIVRGRGAYLYDRRGRKFLDGHSSLWVNLHGHRHPRLDAAIRRQLGRVAHSTLLGQDNDVATRLAGELIRLVRREGLSLDRVFYSDDGSTAVEAAIKIALQYWQNVGQPRRDLFVSFRHGYHGDTLGAVSVGKVGLFHDIFRPLTFESFFAPSPHCYRCPMGRLRGSCAMECLGALRKILEAHRDEIAAMILEPGMQCAGGMIPIPEGYLRRLRELCTENDVLLIADEVAVGFGRTGAMFACGKEGVTPDLLACAKGITGGYLPLAATLATEEVFSAFLGRFEEFRTFTHGHTYSGNALACAAARASLRLFEEGRVLERLQPKIALLSRLLERFRDHPNVGDIRRNGFIAGIELVADRATKAPFPAAARIGHKVCMAARPRGAILRPLGGVLVLFPALSMSEADLERLVSILYDSLCEVLPPGRP